ncbi:Competence protein CoiA-like family [Coleofasciculus chthonoplastes PCC 7420]|uniref:Competence protein CoiA-like family n=1 Tax=Coleofasciculus chthonoplastes PCC 7420 TaxID=118168 RepID=B4W520_9CYAN|nr:competence protein CoiA family protein [Coleofasciculus chthonoplastes]EDX70713.1 Competence protein CoiA-like family [Coleofasciculus chthonoplastes PCC 7420]
MAIFTTVIPAIHWFQASYLSPLNRIAIVIHGNTLVTGSKIMLCAIKGTDNKKIIAKDASKQDVPFYCPKCSKEVCLRKGRIRIHHFAHKPPVTCGHGIGESEAHRQCKTEIYKSLLKHPKVQDCELEKNLGSVIPDIFAVIDGTPVALEVQISSLTIDEVIRRTEDYSKKKIYLLWLGLRNKEFNEEKYSPKAWEKWLHAMYYGRVYYWVTGLKLQPIHFSDYHLYVKESTWYEDGEERSAGGYYKYSKRYKTPIKGKLVNITEHFQAMYRQIWKGGNIFIPECKLYIDRQNTWWKSE